MLQGNFAPDRQHGISFSWRGVAWYGKVAWMHQSLKNACRGAYYVGDAFKGMVRGDDTWDSRRWSEKSLHGSTIARGAWLVVQQSMTKIFVDV